MISILSGFTKIIGRQLTELEVYKDLLHFLGLEVGRGGGEVWDFHKKKMTRIFAIWLKEPWLNNQTFSSDIVFVVHNMRWLNEQTMFY